MTISHKDIIPLSQKFAPEEQIKVKNAVDIYISESIKGKDGANPELMDKQADILNHTSNPQLIIDYLPIVGRTGATEEIRRTAINLIIEAFTP